MPYGPYRTGALSERRRVVLGSKPVALRPFTARGAAYVFAACDRPTVIYSAAAKLLFSHVNDDEARPSQIDLFLGGWYTWLLSQSEEYRSRLGG